MTMHGPEVPASSPSCSLIWSAPPSCFARLGDDAAEGVRHAHFDVLREAIALAGGDEVKTIGDGVMAAFTSPVEALGCAVAIQRAVHMRNEARPQDALAVRVGLNVGEPIRTGGDYHGMAVNVAARLCGHAAGGQILASELIAAVVGSRGGFRFRAAGRLKLKGVPEAVAAVVVEWKVESVEASPRAPLAPVRPGPRAVAARRPRLVGRDAELTAIESELSRAAGGEFRCVLVVADPGMGKTRLSGELVARHPEALTLSARRSSSGGNDVVRTVG